MFYQDKYEKYLDDMVADIEKCKISGKRIVFGYTSDADALLTYDEKEFNEILEKYLTCEPHREQHDVVDSMETFARLIAYYMMNGLGGEVDISDYKVVEYLLEHFQYTFSLGGTGAQGATAMCCAGMPVLAHISDRSKLVCELMDYPEMETVQNGKIVPITALQRGEPVYHIVFSYTKGDRFRIGNKEYEVPVANRVILDYDRIHKDIVVDGDFKQYLEENANKLISYNLSGFNAIVDNELAQRRLSELGIHYTKIKEKNAECVIYFESAHYLSPEVKATVYAGISPYVSIMGMNEEELVAHGMELGMEIDKDDISDVLKGMDVIAERYKAKGIILHTKDYSMYYGEELKNVDLEKGLTLGNLLSGTRARVGHYGNREECRESLKMNLSPVGLRFAEELANMRVEKQVFLVPSRYMEKPMCTIGLGDTFVAGVQFGFIK